MCNCAETADAKLAWTNTAIDWACLINPKTRKTVERLQIKTKKIETRRKTGPSVLVCSYCPFCGERLPDNGDGRT